MRLQFGAPRADEHDGVFGVVRAAVIVVAIAVTAGCGQASGGSKMTYTFTGRSIALVTEKGTGYGGLRVSVDGGTPVTLDLHAASRSAVVIPWATSFPSSGRHTVTFTVVKASGKVQADIDAIAVVS